MKLDTLSEPSAHLIEENVVLPEDTFSSYLNYLLYELVHCKPIVILVSVITTLVLLIIPFHNIDICAVVFMISFSLSILSLFLVVMHKFVLPVAEQGFIIKLLVEVIAYKPAGMAWGTIACNMNQYLFKERLWNTPYYFFTTFIREVNSGSLSDSSSNNTEDTQSPVSAKKTSNDPNRFHYIRSDPFLMTYV